MEIFVDDAQKYIPVTTNDWNQTAPATTIRISLFGLAPLRHRVRARKMQKSSHKEWKMFAAWTNWTLTWSLTGSSQSQLKGANPPSTWSTERWLICWISIFAVITLHKRNHFFGSGPRNYLPFSSVYAFPTLFMFPSTRFAQKKVLLIYYIFFRFIFSPLMKSLLLVSPEKQNEIW